MRGSITKTDQLSKTLIDEGAISSPTELSQDKARIKLEHVTHIITKTIDFPEYSAVTDPALNINVVKPQWVTASVNKGKQTNPRQHSPDPKMFFSGLTVSCADLPNGDKDAIVGYVLAVGGVYSSSLNRQVTHIVALTTDADKCRAALDRDYKCKIVLPHW